MSNACLGCAAEVHAGTNLCRDCVHTLDKSLANIATYYDDLDTLRQKRTRYGGASTKGSIGKAQPLPLDGRFTDPTGQGSQVAWDTKNTITTWTRICLDEWPPIPGQACLGPCLHVTCHTIKARVHPRDTVASCCRYLARNRVAIAGKDWAGEILDELLDLEHRLSNIVDRPKDAWYAGVCGYDTETDVGVVTCTRELYAEPGAVFVRCQDCGSTYDVEARRKALLAEAEDREVTARTLARVVTTLGASGSGEAAIENRITTWVARGRLKPGGKRVIDGRPRPVYRVGDVLDLLADDAEARRA